MEKAQIVSPCWRAEYSQRRCSRQANGCLLQGSSQQVKEKLWSRGCNCISSGRVFVTEILNDF